MPSLITLAFWAVVSIGGLFAIHSAWTRFTGWVAAPYVTAQIASDQKAVDAAAARATRAEKQAADSQADIAMCTASLDKQSDLVKKWQADAAQRLKDSQRAKADAIIANAGKATSVAELQRQAHTASVKIQSCQQELDKVTEAMREGARARLHPGAK